MKGLSPDCLQGHSLEKVVTLIAMLREKNPEVYTELVDPESPLDEMIKKVLPRIENTIDQVFKIDYIELETARMKVSYYMVRPDKKELLSLLSSLITASIERGNKEGIDMVQSDEQVLEAMGDDIQKKIYTTDYKLSISVNDENKKVFEYLNGFTIEGVPLTHKNLQILASQYTLEKKVLTSLQLIIHYKDLFKCMLTKNFEGFIEVYTTLTQDTGVRIPKTIIERCEIFVSDNFDRILREVQKDIYESGTLSHNYHPNDPDGLLYLMSQRLQSIHMLQTLPGEKAKEEVMMMAKRLAEEVFYVIRKVLPSYDKIKLVSEAEDDSNRDDKKSAFLSDFISAIKLVDTFVDKGRGLDVYRTFLNFGVKSGVILIIKRYQEVYKEDIYRKLLQSADINDKTIVIFRNALL